MDMAASMQATADVDSARGVAGWGLYGFEITGFAESSDLLVPSEPDWPRLVVERARPDATVRQEKDFELGEPVVGVDHAVLWITERDRLEIDRSPLRVRFTTERLLSDELVAHPYIAFPIAVASHWLGRQVLHGGAVIRHGRAWGLLGTKEAGKSSTLGSLAAGGHSIVSDDILAIEHGIAFAGPRTIDLRAEAAAVLGGREIAMLGGRERFRLQPGAVPASCPLGGIIYLEWGDELRVEVVAPAERLVLLIGNSAIGPDLVVASAFLDLAALPTWRLVRPRRLDVLEDANRQLLEAIDAVA
jgi:hypothetical protein